MQTLDASVALLRSEVGTGPLRRAARALPLPVRQRIQGVRSAAGRSRSAGERIPPPAPVQLSRARHGLRRAATAPYPPPRRRPPAHQTQEHLTQAWRVAVRLRQTQATRSRKAAAVPKGPVYRHWKHGYQQMVTAIVPHGGPWLVVTAGSPKKVRDARTPAGSRFPDTHDGRPFADDLAHIAQLEALRFAGSGYLVVPEGSRPWFRRQTELRDHIVRTYRTVVDDPGAGAVFDLAAMAVVGARSLRGEVGRLAAGVPQLPAVLDWTDIDVAPELTGLATFRPPEGVRLPYLDNSVDIVVVDGAHDLDDARRVASLGVITVAPGATGVVVERVEGSADGQTPAGTPRARLVGGHRIRRSLASAPRRTRGRGRRGAPDRRDRRGRALDVRAGRPRRRHRGGAARASSPRCDRGRGQVRRGASRLGRRREGAARRRAAGGGRRHGLRRPVGGPHRRFVHRRVCAVARLRASGVLGTGARGRDHGPVGCCRGTHEAHGQGRSCASGARRCGRAAARWSTNRRSPRCASPATAASRRSRCPCRRGSGCSTSVRPDLQGLNLTWRVNVARTTTSSVKQG